MLSVHFFALVDLFGAGEVAEVEAGFLGEGEVL